MRLRVLPPTIGGHLPVRVSGKTWGVPQGSKVAHADPGLAYVLDVTGRLHALVAAGEVTIPEEVRDAIKRRYFA